MRQRHDTTRHSVARNDKRGCSTYSRVIPSTTTAGVRSLIHSLFYLLTSCQCCERWRRQLPMPTRTTSAPSAANTTNEESPQQGGLAPPRCVEQLIQCFSRWQGGSPLLIVSNTSKSSSCFWRRKEVPPSCHVKHLILTPVFSAARRGDFPVALKFFKYIRLYLFNLIKKPAEPAPWRVSWLTIVPTPLPCTAIFDHNDPKKGLVLATPWAMALTNKYYLVAKK